MPNWHEIKELQKKSWSGLLEADTYVTDYSTHTAQRAQVRSTTQYWGNNHSVFNHCCRCFVMRERCSRISLQIHKSWNLYLFALNGRNEFRNTYIYIHWEQRPRRNERDSFIWRNWNDCQCTINANRWHMRQGINKYIRHKSSERWKVMNFHSIMTIDRRPLMCILFDICAILEFHRIV